MPSPYIDIESQWIPGSLVQSEDRLSCRYVELMNNAFALNATHMGTATSTALATAQMEQSEILQRMQQRAFETLRLDTVIHDEWRYVKTPASRTPKDVADKYARFRAHRGMSKFAKFEERVNEIQSRVHRNKKLQYHAAKAVRSFSSW